MEAHNHHFHLHVPHFPDDPLLNGFIQATIAVGSLVLSFFAFDLTHADAIVVFLTNVVGLLLKLGGVLTVVYASINFYWSWKDRKKKKQ